MQSITIPSLRAPAWQSSTRHCERSVAMQELDCHAGARNNGSKSVGTKLLIHILVFIFITGCFVFSVANATCQPAHRIISLAPNLTELMYTVGAQDVLIAVDEASDYPPAAKLLPKVADYHDIDVEKVISFHPDLILAWAGGNPQAQLAQLKNLGINVQLFNITRLLDIPVAMTKIGCLTGHQKQAQQKVMEFLKSYQAEKSHVRSKTPVTVFFELSQEPLLTLTKNSLVNDMIEACGGRNIFANVWGVAPEVSMEAVIAAKPQVMIGTQSNWEKPWASWLIIPAVKTGKLSTINPDYVFRPTYRSLTGLKMMCEDINSHPTSR